MAIRATWGFFLNPQTRSVISTGKVCPTPFHPSWLQSPWLLPHTGSHNLQQLSKLVVNCSFMASSSFCSRQTTSDSGCLSYLSSLERPKKRHWFCLASLSYKESESVSGSVVSDWDPMGYSPPGFSVHGILQARILEWIAISFSRASSWPKDGTQVTRITGRFFTVWATREVHLIRKGLATSKSFNMSVLNIYFLD